MPWPTNNSVPMNSLFYTCIQQTPKYFNPPIFNPKDRSLNCNQTHLISDTKLPLFIRQQILDYFVRERIPTNADLICELLSSGGVNRFDLWTLCEINTYNDNDVCKIIDQLTLNCDNLIELNIGGPEWIYNAQLINNQLMNLFVDGNLVKLESLKLQQANSAKLVNKVLSNCRNLIKLEIREPSITDQHLNQIANELIRSDEHQFKLQKLILPSSVRNKGLFDCFKLFTNLNSLSISNFEPLLDYLDETDLNDSNNKQFINQLKQQLKQLIKLTITCPMGQQSVEQIVRYCPNINELNLEVQEIMYLKPICKLKSLKSLSLHNSPNLPLSFLTEVLPILEKIGHQFISLSLEQFDVLDLVEINKFCPELNSFSAQWFTLLSVGRSSFRLLGDSFNMFAMAALRNANRTDHFIHKRKSKDEFSNLRLLRLRPRLNRDLSSLAIEYIVRNAKHLQYLELYCCKQFNDALIARWFELNGGFKELKYLIVRHCNDLNRTTIAKLLNKSPLMYLELDEPLLSKTELLPNSDDPIDLPILI